VRNPEAIAWTIAAEGYISLKSNHNSYQPRVGMANTEKEFIDKFYIMVGNIGHIYSYDHHNPRHRIKWFWELYSLGGCLEFLLQIKDYLPIKREQADIVIDYCTRSLNRIDKTNGLFRGSPEWYAAWDFNTNDIENRLDHERMAELNQRGVI